MHIGTSRFDIFAVGCFYCVDYRNIFTEFAFVVLIPSILFIFLGPQEVSFQQQFGRCRQDILGICFFNELSSSSID